MPTQIGPVLILGAGATKACNGPLTNEVLLEAEQAVTAIEREGYLSLIDEFLQDVFRLPPRPVRVRASYPSLPLLMSVIDMAIDRGQPLGGKYGVTELREVRAAIDYAIFAVLEYKLRRGIPDFHKRAIDFLFPLPAESRIISLNYDIIADNTLVDRSEAAFPDYCCEIQTETY